jgi:hypothetical protein
MIPYNLLLLPLIAGYIILTYSVFFRYNFQRYKQNRLLFEAIFISVVIIFLVFISRGIIQYFFPKYIPILIHKLSFIPIQKVDYLWTAVFSFLISIIAVPFSNYLIIKALGKNKPLIWAVNKYGDEIEKLFMKSFIEGKLLIITLNNNKVYIGFSEIVPEPQKTNFLILTPILSGYRESETKKLVITTNYFEVVEKFIANLDNDKESISLNTDIVLKQDEILTASIYEQEIYDLFNK